MPDPTSAPPSTTRVPLVGVIAGAVCSVALFALAKWVSVAEIDAGRYTQMSISLLIFALAGFFVGRTVRRSGQTHTTRAAGVGFGATLLGLAVGTVLWTWLEGFAAGARQRHTLFPIEIALLWMLGALPILAGIVAGMLTTPAKVTTNN